MLLDGLKAHPSAPDAVSPEMIAATASWAIYGGAKEWVKTPCRPPSEQAADVVMALVAPILSLPRPAPPARRGSLKP